MKKSIFILLLILPTHFFGMNFLSDNTKKMIHEYAQEAYNYAQAAKFLFKHDKEGMILAGTFFCAGIGLANFVVISSEIAPMPLIALLNLSLSYPIIKLGKHYTKIQSDIIKIDNRVLLNLAMSYAMVEETKVALIKSLLEKGIADVNYPDDAMLDNTALFHCLLQGDTKAADILKQYGANIEARNLYNETPLIWMALGNTQIRKKAIIWLLKNGANSNACDIHKETALHKACRYFYFDSIRLLCKAGADVDAQNKDGLTPLHIIVEKMEEEKMYHWPPNLKVIEYLLEQGADCSLEDKYKKTPADYAQNEKVKAFFLSRKLV